MEDQFKEKTWAEEQEEARRIISEQEKAIAASKKQNAPEEAGEENYGQIPADALDRERGARFGKIIAMERARAAQAAAGGAPSSAPELAKIDEQILAAEKIANSSWQPSYLMLTVGAGICDLLQLAGDATIFLSIISSITGLVFSVTRYIVLRTQTREIGNSTLEKQMLARTLVSGAISIIPLVDFLPEQTAAMFIEWNKRREIADEASEKLSKLKKLRAEAIQKISIEEEGAEALGLAA